MKSQKYRPEIDGLRAVAVLFVVVYHAFPTKISGGFIGVDVFFVISGFLITTLILENIESGTFKFRDFYYRRIVRLFPALAIVLLSTLAFGNFILFPDELIQVGRNAIAGTLFVANFLSWSEAGYFDFPSTTKPLLHLWSLGIEEQFYIIWPLLLWFARKSAKKLLSGMIIIMVISFVINLITVQTDSTQAFYSPITRVWELAAGGILALVMIRIREVQSRNILLNQKSANTSDNPFVKVIENKSAKSIFGIIGLFMIFWGAFEIESEKAFPGAWALIPVVGTILIIFSTSGDSFLQKILRLRLLVAFGLISYPLYLWHWPILVYTRMIFGKNILTSHLLIALFVAVILSGLTFVFIEKPIKRIRMKLQTKAAILSTFMAAALLVGIQFSIANQLENRINPESKQTNEPESKQTNEPESKQTNEPESKQTNEPESKQTNEPTLTPKDKAEEKKPIIKRDGVESPIGSSLRWFEGKDNWLFLGNAFGQTIDKLTLKIKPSQAELDRTSGYFERLASTADRYGTDVSLLIGPSKPSIYSEFLPSQVVLSKNRYINFFIERMGNIQNLTVFDPTQDLIEAKNNFGLLYSRTDTHWNNKGAFVAYERLLKILRIPAPKVEFKSIKSVQGDLVSISGLKDYPVEAGDNWEVIWKNGQSWSLDVDIKSGTFNNPVNSINEKAISNEYVWVIGDSFSTAVNPYIYATFNRVSYIGSWQEKLESLPEILKNAPIKPDLIIVIRTERDF